MLRVVVAVALLTALLGLTLPILEDARVDHADSRVSSELDRLETAATALAEQNDPVPANGSGARRTLTLSLPERSWHTAGVEVLTFEPASTPRSVRWRVGGGQSHQRRLADGLVVGPPGGLELSGGRQRVVLALERGANDTVVEVRRPRGASHAGGGNHD